MKDANQTEFRPHDPIDLQDQNTIFLALEELGVAHMQHHWVSVHCPENGDLPLLKEQAAEFFEDLAGIFMGRAGEDRVKKTGWAGEKLAAHLLGALPAGMLARYGAAQGAGTEDVVRAALRAYGASLDKISDKLDREREAGAKLNPKVYIDLMAMWSGVFSGLKGAFSLPEDLMP